MEFNSSVVVLFDKDNKQLDYQYIAKDKNGESHVGWIVIEQPWYCPKESWTYWLYSNKYGPGGFCSGAVDLGFERVAIEPSTIQPFNQINEIKYYLEREGQMVQLVRKHWPSKEEEKDNVLAEIHNENEIPYELWNL